MSLGSLVNVQNLLAFLLCNLVGQIAGSFVPAGEWAVYLPMVIAYHLFLMWLLLSSGKKMALCMPLISSILTHLCCVGVVVSLPTLRHYIPYFSLFRFGATFLAAFELNWLFAPVKFSQLEEKRSKKSKALTTAEVMALSTGEDHQAWLDYLSTRTPGDVRRGLTLKEEYEQWLRARIRRREAAMADGAPVDVRTPTFNSLASTGH